MALSEWEVIANYESFELVKRDYKKRHGLTPNTAHAREIAAPFSHARSYFRSARDAELTVKPLLLYYGAVGLSRGLTLLLSKGKREATLTPSHGLANKNWGATLSKEPPDFGALEITVTTGGSLIDLLNATSHRSLLRHNNSAVNFKSDAPPLAAGTQFTLGDLLNREPSLQDHYQRWKADSKCAQIAVQIEAEKHKATIQVLRDGQPHVDRPLADRVLAGTQFAFSEENPHGFFYAGPASASLPGMTDWVKKQYFGIGDIWVTAQFAGGARLSKIAAKFSLAYALGMLVRYFPAQWTALVRGQVADAALPTLIAAVDLVEVDFPAVVADFLNEI